MSSMETYHGHVKTPQDAIILFEACRLGILPRVQRRLSEKERQQIRSGSVFVWDEREAGMRRWTDGKSWSASRVSGSFLTYREMEGKRGGTSFTSSTGKKSASRSADGRDSDQDGGEDGPDGYRYKPDGLMKQSFSITTSDNRHLHLISYYARPPANCQPLKQPSSDLLLRNVHPQKGMYPEATVIEPSSIPPVTRGPMGGSPYSSSVPHGGHQQYAYPAAQGYPHAYGHSSWPASPAHTPPTHYPQHPPQGGYSGPLYGSPAYAHLPHHVPPHNAPPPGPTQFDRPPPPPSQTSLPIPPPMTGDHHQSVYHMVTSPRTHPLPPYAQNGPASVLQPNPYGTASLEPPRFDGRPPPPPPPPQSHSYSAPAINGYHKPPTPPSSSNGTTPNEKGPEAGQLALPTASQPRTTISPPTVTHSRLPTINAMLNDPIDYDRSDRKIMAGRSDSRSPLSAGFRPPCEIPDAMAAGGFQKGQNDLDKLKAQFLK